MVDRLDSPVKSLFEQILRSGDLLVIVDIFCLIDKPLFDSRLVPARWRHNVISTSCRFNELVSVEECALIIGVT